MAAIVIVVAALALFFPGTFSVVKTAWVNTLLGIVMFGMGLTLKPRTSRWCSAARKTWSLAAWHSSP